MSKLIKECAIKKVVRMLKWIIMNYVWSLRLILRKVCHTSFVKPEWPKFHYLDGMWYHGTTAFFSGVGPLEKVNKRCLLANTSFFGHKNFEWKINSSLTRGVDSWPLALSSVIKRNVFSNFEWRANFIFAYLDTHSQNLPKYGVFINCALMLFSGDIVAFHL